jgi:hypothetical protein
MGTLVTAHTGSGSMGGMFITEIFRSGEVTKVNKKSIRVRLDSEKCTRNGQTTSEGAISAEATFTFWKNTKSGAAMYKNSRYGIITI